MSKLPINQVLCGDCVSVMKGLSSKSVDLVVTSPPYWGLRDYGVDGQIGLEDHPNSYIEALVLVAKQVKKLLKDSGSFYLNLGDTYFGSNSYSGAAINPNSISYKGNQNHAMPKKSIRNFKSKDCWLQPKQLMLIPSRVAVALQEDGWILRNDIVWYKPNHMPSSVKDRLTNSWEHVFHFVKAHKYYYDLDAIRKPHSNATIQRNKGNWSNQGKEKLGVENGTYTRTLGEINKQNKMNPLGKNPGDIYHGKFEGSNNAELFGSPRARTQRKTGKNNPHRMRKKGDYIPMDPSKPNDLSHPKGKNPADFWKVTTKPFSGAHFATFPPNLIKPMIKSSCPKDGVVLDPFSGSGTALVVAHNLGRKWVGIDLNPEYCELARKRLEGVGAFSSKMSAFLK